MKTFKDYITEVQQPLSQGEKNFVALHKIDKVTNLAPGVTDQDHIFNGTPRREDPKTASYENFRDDDESVEAYDKGLKVQETPERDVDESVEYVEEATIKTDSGTAKVTDSHVHFNNSGYKQKFSHDEIHKIVKGGNVRGFEKEKSQGRAPKDVHVISNGDEDHYLPHNWEKHVPKKVNESNLSAKAARAGKDIGKPGKNFEKIAHSASKKYGSEEAGKKVAGAILAKMRAKGVKEEVEQIDERVDPDDYNIGSEVSKVGAGKGGHRPHITHKETGHTMYLGSTSYKTAEHAKAHAKEYLKGYSRVGADTADKFANDYRKANKEHVLGEDVEQIAELKWSTLNRYASKAKAQSKDPSNPKKEKRAVGAHVATSKLARGNFQEEAELEEKTLTPAELKKREEIAKAMEREHPGMDKSKKMAIATAQAKKVAEEVTELDEKYTDKQKAMKLGTQVGHNSPYLDRAPTANRIASDAADKEITSKVRGGGRAHAAANLLNTVKGVKSAFNKGVKAGENAKRKEVADKVANVDSAIRRRKIAMKKVTEAVLSAKQKKIAKISPPADKIDAGDLAKLRSEKK